MLSPFSIIIASACAALFLFGCDTGPAEETYEELPSAAFEVNVNPGIDCASQPTIRGEAVYAAVKDASGSDAVRIVLRSESNGEAWAVTVTRPKGFPDLPYSTAFETYYFGAQGSSRLDVVYGELAYRTASDTRRITIYSGTVGLGKTRVVKTREGDKRVLGLSLRAVANRANVLGEPVYAICGQFTAVPVEPSALPDGTLGIGEDRLVR